MTQRDLSFQRRYKSDVISCLVSMVDEMSCGQVIKGNSKLNRQLSWTFISVAVLRLPLNKQPLIGDEPRSELRS